jgi:hypothetical protein
MKNKTPLECTHGLRGSFFCAQRPESNVGGKIHLTGEMARTLISILDSGALVRLKVVKFFPMPYKANVVAPRNLQLRAST